MTDQPSAPARIRRPVLSAPKPPSTPIGEAADDFLRAEDNAEQQGDREGHRAPPTSGPALAGFEAKIAAAGAARARASSLAEQPPLAAERPEEAPGVTAALVSGKEVRKLEAGFVARDGDVLVVSYSEVTLPLPKQFAMMKFGGLSYTRRLVSGESPDESVREISTWLSRRAETDGVAKYRRLVAEFVSKKDVG